MTRKLKHRICLAASAIVAMICAIIIIYLPKKDVHIRVPYNAHTFRLLASNNTFLPYDIESFWVDGEVCFIISSNAPTNVTITIIDETDFSEHIEKINVEQTGTINDVPINIV